MLPEEAEVCWIFVIFYAADMNIVSTVYSSHVNGFLCLSRQFRGYDETECEMYIPAHSCALKWFGVIT